MNNKQKATIIQYRNLGYGYVFQVKNQNDEQLGNCYCSLRSQQLRKWPSKQNCIITIVFPHKTAYNRIEHNSQYVRKEGRYEEII